MNDLLVEFMPTLILWGILFVIAVVMYIVTRYNTPIEILLGKDKFIDDYSMDMSGNKIYTIMKFYDNRTYCMPYVDKHRRMFESKNRILLIIKYWFKIH